MNSLSPLNHGKVVRWMPCLNTTNEEIPAYAAMMLAGYGDRPNSSEPTYTPSPDLPFATYGYGAWQDEDGVCYWKVAKPNSQLYIDQAESMVFFNGPTPIAPYGSNGRRGRGLCTQDFPTLAIHDTRKNILLPGIPCTAIPDSWALIAGGKMFTCQGHQQGGPYHAAARPWEHSIWINRGRTRQIADHNHAQDPNVPNPNGGGVAPLARFCPAFSALDRSTGPARSQGFGGVELVSPQGITQATQFLYPSGYMRVARARSGVYMVSFSGTIWADEAVSRGTLLTVGIEIYWPQVSQVTGETVLDSNGQPAGYSTTPKQVFTVQRTQQVEQDTPYTISNAVAKENVSISMPTYIPEFGIIVARNYSGVAIQVTYPALGVGLIGRRDYLEPIATFETGLI